MGGLGGYGNGYNRPYGKRGKTDVVRSLTYRENTPEDFGGQVSLYITGDKYENVVNRVFMSHHRKIV